MSQGSIGGGWLNMGKTSALPTDEDRRQNACSIRRGLPPVRHKVYMRYERLFGTWRVTFSDAGNVLREFRYEHDHTLEEILRRGRALTCLADRQAMELGMRNGSGSVTLQLDADQFAALCEPL